MQAVRTVLIVLVLALTVTQSTRTYAQGEEPVDLPEFYVEQEPVDLPESEPVEDASLAPPVSAAAADWNATQWTVQGRLGVGTETPAMKVDVVGGGVRIVNLGDGATLLNLSSERSWAFRQRGTGAGTALELVSIGGGGNKNFYVTTTGTFAVNGGTLQVSRQGNGAVLLNLASERSWAFRQRGTGAGTALELASIGGGGNKDFIINTTGEVGIGTTAPRAKLDVAGTTRTDILQIDAGGDLAEPFDIAGTDEVEPGMVVAIDPDHPGQLRIADKAYDRTVAGVVSGAGGIQPGLVLEQEGTLAAGDHPVALTGRVYVWADAAEGAIVPGDLLTTSDTPGHAMKVADYEQAQGAILGKAMTALDEGTGLVLVLVSLQ